MKRKKRGGKRRGAGRPPSPPDRKAKLIGVRLYPDELTRLIAVGGESYPEALRIVLAEKGIVDRERLTA